MIYLILLLGFFLRMISINQSLWLDEAIGAIAVHDFSYSQLINNFLTVDNHPPFYYLLLKLWTSIFGYNEIILRLPSVIFGVGIIYLTYLVTKKLIKNNQIAIYFSLLLATSQFAVYYSQEARMYSMVAFFAILSVFLFLKIIDSPNNLKYWISFSVSSLFLAFTDYMPIFLFPALFVYAYYIKVDRRFWKNILFSFLPIIIVGFLWWPIFAKQSAGGKWLIQTLPAWKKLAGGANAKQLILLWMKYTLGRISFNNKIYYYIISAVASIPFGYLILKSIKNFKNNIYIFCLFFIPLSLSFLVSFFIPAFIYFRLLYLLPAFYAMVGLGLSLERNIILRNALIAILIIINLFSLLVYYSDKHQKREEWRSAVAFVEGKIQDNEIVLFSYPEPFAPYRWYEKKPQLSYGSTDSIKSDFNSTEVITKQLIKDKKGVFYFEYLRDISDSESAVLKTIEANGYREDKIYGDFEGVGKIYYFVKE